MTRRLHFRGLNLLFAAGIVVSPVHGLGQDQEAEPSLTGTWEIALQAQGRLGSTPEVLTLTQHPDGSVTGAFVVESLRKEEPISGGRIDDDGFSFTRERTDSRYEGTIEGDDIQGTMIYKSGNQTLSHSFSGTRTSTDVISFAPPPPPPSAGVPTPGGDPAPAAPLPTPGGDPAPVPASLAAVPDPPLGQGILTIDGETRSLSVAQCLTNNQRGQVSLSVGGRDDGGNLSLRAIEHPGTNQQFSVFLDGRAQFQALYLQQTDGSWTSNGEPVQGPLFQINGSTVTASGTFAATGREFQGEHTLAISLECPNQPAPAGWDRDVTAQVPTPGGDPAPPPPAPAAGVSGAQSTCGYVECSGAGTATIDGETLSFSLETCGIMNHSAAGQMWNGRGASERGSFSFNASLGSSQQGASITLPAGRYDATYVEDAGTWTRQFQNVQEGGMVTVPAEGSLATANGSELTVKGTFIHFNDRSEHEVELRVVCE